MRLSCIWNSASKSYLSESLIHFCLDSSKVLKVPKTRKNRDRVETRGLEGRPVPSDRPLFQTTSDSCGLLYGVQGTDD